MQPFVVTAVLSTPVILHKPTPLDGILCGHLAGPNPDEETDREARKTTEALLAMHPSTAGSIAQASSALTHTAGFAMQVPKVRRFRFDKIPFGAAIPNTAKGDEFTVAEPGFRNPMSHYQATAAYAVHWIAVGDLEGVASALSDLHGIGKRRAEGFGEVSDLIVSPIEAGPCAGLLDADGLPVRPIPIDLWERLRSPAAPSRAVETVRPFYWKRADAVEAAVPHRTTFRRDNEFQQFIPGPERGLDLGAGASR